MWRVVAAYGGERYLHQVAVSCASKVLVLCYRSDIQYCVKLLFVSMQFTFDMLRSNKKKYGEVYVKQIINMSAIGEWGGSWGGIFDNHLLKEVRYILMNMQYFVIKSVVNPYNLLHLHIHSSNPTISNIQLSHFLYT